MTCSDIMQGTGVDELLQDRGRDLEQACRLILFFA
jgi:hypothetical protein